MSYFEDEIKSTYQEERFEWQIADFFSKIHDIRGEQVESSSPDFSFGETWWVINLTRERNCDSSLIYAISEDDDAKDVESALALKKIDGSLDRSILSNHGGKFGEDEFYHMYDCDDSKLLERKHELTTSDSLTIVCILKRGTSYYPEPTLSKSPHLKLIGLDTLSENFRNLFSSEGSYDVTIQVKDKSFKAHKAVLVARSPVFAARFEHDTTKKNTDIIKVHDCDVESFHEFLQFIYCGKLENVSFPSILHLYTISDKYDVQELKFFCVQYMERCLTEDNVCDVIMLTEKHNEAGLLSFAREFFKKNNAKIVITPKWKNLLNDNPDFIDKLTQKLSLR